MMEQRFRERAKRSGGGPISTGEIDARVQDEMQQFFSESHDKLEQVVPGLAEEENQGMKETTGEIRRKIDDFFAQVTPEDGEALFGSGPDPFAAPAATPEAGLAGMAAAGSPKFQPQQKPFAGAPTVGQSSGGVPPRPAGFNPPPATTPFRSHATPHQGVPHYAPQPAAGSPPSTSRERPTLDLKTALEKLRRTGSSGDDVVADSVPRRPEPLRRREPAPPSEPMRAFQPPVAPPPEPAIVPEPTFAPSTPPAEPQHHRFGPRPAVPTREAEEPEADALPPELDRFALHADEPPAWTPPSAPARGVPPLSSGTSDRRDRVELPQSDTPVEPIAARIRAARTLPPPPVATPPEPPRDAAPRARRPERSASPKGAKGAKGKAAEGNFDDIFSEVQNLVLDSLKGSVSESFTAAHEMSQEISEEISQRVSQRISDVAVRAAEQARARSRAPAEPEERPDPRSGRRDRPEPGPRSGRRPVATGEYLEDEDDEAPSAFGSPDIRRSPRPLSSVLPAPSDDEEMEDQADEAAPSGPYDWGVKKKAPAPGAWLLDSEDTPVPESAAPAVAARAKPEPEPEPEADAGPAAGGGAGARGYLQRKLAQEVDNLGPALEALERRAVLTARETAAIRGRAEDTDDLDGDAEMSVDTFVDDRPRGEADAMTPMKLVEQLRTVRRLQELLIEKGLIDPTDLERATEE